MYPFLALIFLLIFSSCSKENNEESNFLVFGHFYGECIGEQCVEIFKLTSTDLSEDSKDNYPGQSSFYNANFNPVSNDKFELVKGLADYFPTIFWNENETVIGQPDAGDWGGFYIEIKNSEGHDFWLLDKNKNYAPAEYHAFIDTLNSKIALISD
jgi:hypothetical protein